MKPVAVRLLRPIVLLAAAIALFFGLRVRESLADWGQKNATIRQMQKGNADLENAVKEKRRYLDKVAKDPREREFVVKDRLGLQRRNESSIIVPGQKGK